MSEIGKIAIKNILARLDKSKNKEWLGRETGIGSGAISAILNGKTKNPGIETYEKIAIALECTIADLTTDGPIKKDESKDELFQRIGELTMEVAKLKTLLENSAAHDLFRAFSEVSAEKKYFVMQFLGLAPTTKDFRPRSLNAPSAVKPTIPNQNKKKHRKT